jgi:hypothetical protein
MEVGQGPNWGCSANEKKIGNTALFLAIAFARKFCHFCHPVFTSFGFRNNNFLQSKGVSLASSSKPGGPGLCI